MARQVVTVNILNTCAVAALSVADYVTLLVHLADLRIAVGAVYNALLLHAAWKSEVDQMIILNAHDFRRVYPRSPGESDIFN